MVEQLFKKNINGVQSIYSPKLKGLLYKRLDRVNRIGRLYKQLRYPWLSIFVSKISRVQTMNSPKLKGSLIKRPDKDEINGMEWLHMQLVYSWLNNFLRKKSGKYNGLE